MGREPGLSPPANCLLPTAHSLDILGVRVDDVTYDEALAAIEGFVVSSGPRSTSRMGSD